MSEDENETAYELMPWTGELNVNPWDSMLAENRRAAYRAAWIDERINQEIKRERALIESDGAGFDDLVKFEHAVRARAGELREWIEQSRKERAHLTKVASDAVRAGLSERYIDSLRAEARMIAEALTKALDAANLTPQQRAAASEALRVALADMGPILAARQDAATGTVTVRPEIGR